MYAAPDTVLYEAENEKRITRPDAPLEYLYILLAQPQRPQNNQKKYEANFAQHKPPYEIFFLLLTTNKWNAWSPYSFSPRYQK